MGMKSYLKSFLVSVLSLQLMGLPLLAEGNSSNQNNFVEQVRKQFETKMEDSTRDGWRFFNKEKQELNAAEFMVVVAKDGDYYATSPVVEALGAPLNLRVTMVGDLTDIKDSVTIKLKVLDRDMQNTVVARSIKISLKADGYEANQLLVKRSLKSMEAEILQHKDQLASLRSGSPVYAALSNMLEFLIPSAHAGDITARVGNSYTTIKDNGDIISSNGGGKFAHLRASSSAPRGLNSTIEVGTPNQLLGVILMSIGALALVMGIPIAATAPVTDKNRRVGAGALILAGLVIGFSGFLVYNTD